MLNELIVRAQSIEIERPDTTSITDWQSWPDTVWQFIAAGVVAGVAIIFWRNIGGVARSLMLAVAVLIIIWMLVV